MKNALLGSMIPLENPPLNHGNNTMDFLIRYNTVRYLAKDASLTLRNNRINGAITYTNCTL